MDNETNLKHKYSKSAIFTYTILAVIISFCIFYLLTLPSFMIGKVKITGNSILKEEEIYKLFRIPQMLVCNEQRADRGGMPRMRRAYPFLVPKNPVLSS